MLRPVLEFIALLLLLNGVVVSTGLFLLHTPFWPNIGSFLIPANILAIFIATRPIEKH